MAKECGYLVDALPALVWSAHLDGYFHFVNNKWSEYTGVELETVRGFGWHRTIHPDDLRQLLECLKPLSGAEEEETGGRARVRRFDGNYEWFLFRVRPLVDAAGRVISWSGSAMVTEEQKSAADSLDARDCYFYSILNDFPALITLWSPAGKLEHANHRRLEYSDTTLEQIRHFSIDDGFHPDDRPLAVEALKTAVENMERRDFMGRMRRADGSYRWHLNRIFPFLGKEKQPSKRWYLLQADFDAQTRAEALVADEKLLLEMVATGQPMPHILDRLCRFVESKDDGCYCSILLINAAGTHIEYGAAPTLARSFIEPAIGAPANAEIGPCAMAVVHRRRVVVPDLAADTRWETSGWRALALAHGLRSCWSMPVLSSTGKVMGVFTFYYDKPRSEAEFDSNLISQLTHFAGIAIERAQNDATLARSDARHAAILNSAFDCIVTIDHDGRITEFNPAAERTFGYAREETIGKLMADIIVPPSLRLQHLKGLARYLQTGVPHVIGNLVELTAMRADGSEFPVELAITRIPLDGPPSFTGYLRDISERKRIEMELRRSAAFLAEAQKLSLTGSFYRNESKDEHFWSDETARIFEYEGSDKLRLNLLFDRVVPQDLPILQHAFSQMDAGLDFDYECRFSMPSGVVKTLHVVAHKNHDLDGNLEYIGAVQDVTEQRISEEAVNKLRSELAHVARVTSLGVLAASIAHEVSQPLSGIVTNTSTCMRMLESTPPNVTGARETIRRTMRDANRASEVITRLRALFRNSAVSNEIVDLNEAAREVIALSRSEIKGNQVNLILELTENLAPIAGDRVQLQQVVLNLLLNALDAMSGVRDRSRQLVIKTENIDGEVRFTCQDNGEGFLPLAVEKQFDAFYTTKAGGMGVGLSVSRTIVEGHHGHLWAELNEGPGATFLFSIPLNREGFIDAERDRNLSAHPSTAAESGISHL